MANVIFKRGPQAHLTTATTPYKDGTFYLTTDTNRLYADYNGKRALLNQTVQFVASTSALMAQSASWTAQEKADHVNDFYYIVEGNILATYTGTGPDGGWKQINPDTNATMATANFAVTSATNGVSLGLTVADSEGNDASASQAFIGADGVTVAEDNGNIKISGDPYALAGDIESNQFKISLSSAGSTSQVVALSTTGGNVHFAKNGATLTIYTDNAEVSGATLNVTTGTLAISVSDSGGGSASATATNVGIILNNGSNGSQYLPIASTSGINSQGEIYSKDEIDRLIKGLDGMTFKGLVGSSTALPTTGVQNGDVYVVATSGLHKTNFPGATFETGLDSPLNAGEKGTVVGDMFIAKGTETNGVITSGLSWVYIPAGNDSLAEVSYAPTITTATHTIDVKDDGGSGSSRFGVTLNAGDDIALTSAQSGNLLSTTIAHRAISTSTSAAAVLSAQTNSFQAIKAISTTNGHVISITTDTFTPVKYTLSGGTATNTTGGASFAITLGNDGTEDATIANFSIKSNSLKISATNNNAVAVELEWDTF